MVEIFNIQTLTTSILVAVLTSFLSVHLALRRYRTENWWERKAECYIDSVNVMNDIIRFCDNTLAELDGLTISNEEKEELKRKFHKGKLLLETQTNIGHLLVSKKAHADLLALDRAMSSADREENIMQQIAGIRVETENCLHVFIPHAKEDLNVQKL